MFSLVFTTFPTTHLTFNSFCLAVLTAFCVATTVEGAASIDMCFYACACMPFTRSITLNVKAWKCCKHVHATYAIKVRVFACVCA